MRKLYFAMVPKGSFLKDAAVAAGLGAALVYGAGRVLGGKQSSDGAPQEQEAENRSVWGEEPEQQEPVGETSAGTLNRVRGALRVAKAASKLLLTVNTKLLNVLSKEDSQG